MPENNSLKSEYFDDVYAKKNDPWDFETSEYEKAKYAATINALGEKSFANGFEIGCSIGVLTKQLADRVKNLLAVDVSEAPLRKAKERLAGNAHVEFRKMSVPEEFPDHNFDLIVVSEVGYYLSRADLEKLKTEIVEHLLPGGSILLVHWLPEVHDYPLTGDEVHEAFYKLTEDNGPLKVALSKREEKYRLDLFEKISQ